jgi:hypothetical protein
MTLRIRFPTTSIENAMALNVGTRLGPCEILAAIGSGGMTVALFPRGVLTGANCSTRRLAAG